MLDTASLIYTPSQVRAMDSAAIEERGIPGYTLMTRAGEATLAAAYSRYPGLRRWLVLCGAGNNAGDGYVIARLARAAGLDVTVGALSEPRRLGGDAARAWQDFERAGGQVTPFSAGLLDGAELIIDAMLGTGLDRAVEGIYQHAVESVNEMDLPVVAVDIPSGLNGLNGAVMGAAVRANVTVTFVGRKLGLYLGAGPDLAGDVLFAGLDIPADIATAATPSLRLFTSADLRRVLPPRAATAHKGNFGHVLVVGGNYGMTGAVRLAGESALRVGAGLVTVATRPGNAPFVTASRPEIMAHGIEQPADIEPLLARATVVALGPGLGQDDWARGLFGRIVGCGHPTVIDADALNLLVGSGLRRDDWILTPHPGEAGRLLGETTAAVQADRLAALGRLTERFGGTSVLKGRCTLVGARGDIPYLIDRGNPGMATAGMGDVLTGLVAGILAQARIDSGTAAAAAAFVHGLAGDAAARGGQRGLLASDLFPELRACLNPSA